jgi:hypothetical protein
MMTHPSHYGVKERMDYEYIPRHFNSARDPGSLILHLHSQIEYI